MADRLLPAVPVELLRWLIRQRVSPLVLFARPKVRTGCAKKLQTIGELTDDLLRKKQMSRKTKWWKKPLTE